jgi:hypothetical protein
MNVFEDLVEELKEENLLEETVINTISAEEKRKEEESQRQSAAPVEFSSVSENKVFEERSFNEFAVNEEETFAAPQDFGAGEAAESADFAFAESSATADSENVVQTDSSPFEAPKSPADEMEFYRRRAMDEVTSLQLVEHVFSGVEREQMKIAPKQFDDVAVKKALHDFLQVSKDIASGDSAQAEFKLMQETESWCSALSYRDKNISVSDLRRFCETTKPALSAQALLALARFYRNLPHTEAVRSKFDMVLTRLFAVEIGDERRELVSSRDEMIKKIAEHYADWASVPLYSEADETELLLTTVKFDDFLAEAQGTDDFDELVKNDFYNRLRLFKESIGDKFYAPAVLASAIECNVHVGNRYVELLEKECENESTDAIQVKYGFLLDQVVSDAAGKTLQLSELLTEKTAMPVAEMPAEPKETLRVKSETAAKKRKAKAAGNGFFGISTWLLVALAGVIVLTVVLYGYVEFGSSAVVSPDVQKVNLENSSFKDYLQSARIHEELLIGIVTDNWNAADEEKKQEVLGKLLNAGKEKGFKKVHLLNREGVSVGYATETEIVVKDPTKL